MSSSVEMLSWLGIAASLVREWRCDVSADVGTPRTWPIEPLRLVVRHLEGEWRVLRCTERDALEDHVEGAVPCGARDDPLAETSVARRFPRDASCRLVEERAR